MTVHTLIGIVTCERFKDRADQLRKCWAGRAAHGASIRFFLARQDRPPLPDEVYLDVPDDYPSLPLKVKAMCQWARQNGFSGGLLKVDDDVVDFYPDRLLADTPQQDYVGFLNNAPSPYVPYCSGFSYWLSYRAMTIVADAKIPEGEWAEDRFVGGVLFDAGIRPVHDPRFNYVRRPHFLPHDPMTVIAVCNDSKT